MKAVQKPVVLRRLSFLYFLSSRASGMQSTAFPKGDKKRKGRKTRPEKNIVSTRSVVFFFFSLSIETVFYLSRKSLLCIQNGAAGIYCCFIYYLKKIVKNLEKDRLRALFLRTQKWNGRRVAVTGLQCWGEANLECSCFCGDSRQHPFRFVPA